jgi:hypothetical protein
MSDPPLAIFLKKEHERNRPRLFTLYRDPSPPPTLTPPVKRWSKIMEEWSKSLDGEQWDHIH